ncbi:MAG: DUF1433 domain-containing protein [Staphylococcus lugdunensis]|uniref:DUF1433 domain-containing protein n=3 Tax=Staphylococcus TaxID=1279 RepID=UPI000A96FC29|nr:MULTISPECIES: DUF1433 domain-containing protein [Staphylococcus]MCI2814051.1 DUF1433 domain-containing protein [Staphylococcus lugdunensis]MDU0965850.1 DUF1433 domain-containing protein [Staphylococcus lugdunensis]MDU1965845.1 DUF1433 domain-containing protein [Staphylococcus lugdunensis]MDU2320958.1 DUF1433 domain-containing protein [Staphylococcus lugdunensis]MDU2405338.1 DUF1433 domain-containing protein [Staphylococcus lugdunensis]
MNKKIFLTVIILISIILIVGGVYLKMKYDEQKEKEQKYYNEQKERITLYMKYNVKDFKNIEFTEFKKNLMDGYDISGYINKDKNLSFSVGIRSTENFQFNGNISYSEELENKFIKNTKTVSQIKKEHR